jgi:hypothetical protein
MGKRRIILLPVIVIAAFLPFIPLYLHSNRMDLFLIGSIAGFVIFISFIQITRTRKGESETVKRKETNLYAFVYVISAIAFYIVGLIKMGK